MVLLLEHDCNLQLYRVVTMLKLTKRNRETLAMAIVGLVLMASLNIMMLHYNYEPWTNPKVGFWSAFYPRFEISGFDSTTYIMISKWRPLYVITRHPLLAVMVWPLSQLNSWLMAEYHINCAIFIVCVVWTLLALASWLLTFRLMREAVKLSFFSSVLMTVWFFSFSHILLVTFTPDHMSISLPLLLLTLLLAARAAERKQTMPLWQALPLLFVSTGVTTTNMIKVAIADFFTQWGRRPFRKIVVHFLAYLIPLTAIAILFIYQQNTTEAEEKSNNERQMQKKADKDEKFAAEWDRQKKSVAKKHEMQIVDLPFVTNTEYCIDRLPSVVENVFGEGIILHTDYALKDANKERPVLVVYSHWWFYALETLTVLLFMAGMWIGRRERLVWMCASMFAFDMLLHVGLEFASADLYIMTAHWAFALPIAVGFLLKSTERKSIKIYTVVQCAILFLALFQWVHNMSVIVPHIMG